MKTRIVNIILVIALTAAICSACTAQRYTSEILWPADPIRNLPSILVVEFPRGVPASAIVVMDATDSATSETRAQAAAPYTPPVETK